MTESLGPAVTGPRILVVDDDPVMLDLMEDLLSHEGYEVLREGSGESALATVATRIPRAALVDLILPGLDDVLDAWAVPTRPPPSVIGHDDDRRGPTTASGRSTIRAGSPRAPTRPSVAAP